MPRRKAEPQHGSRSVSLHIGPSTEAGWEQVVQPWFHKIAASTFRNGPAVVVTASRSQAYFFRERLLAAGGSLLDVKFLSASQLRALLLLRARDLHLPPSEHLRLLLAAIAENIANELADSEAGLIADSIARDPSHLLRVLDQLCAAGWSFEEIESTSLGRIATNFEKELRECGWVFVSDADRAIIKQTKDLDPLFGNLLLFGFDAAHWPLWPLLHASTVSSAKATVVLADPRDEARDLDETWVGTWEEAFGPAEPIASIDQKESSPSSAKENETDISNFSLQSLSKIHFLVGRDVTQQARAIVALAAKFLSDAKCERLGILFSGTGALPRWVAHFLKSDGIAHNDGIAHLAPSVFDDDAWRAWLELQQSPRLKPLFRFIRSIGGAIFDGVSIAQAEDTLGRAYNELVLDDLELLRDYCANESGLRNGVVVARGLEKIEFLPENADLNGFLKATKAIFSNFEWKERWSEIERISRGWSDRFALQFSKSSYLRWLRDVISAPAMERDDLGANSYARVHLLTYQDAQNQSWSHLIFAGLNDETWSDLDQEVAFVGDEQIADLNRKNKVLNRRASTQGRQGEGHSIVREGKTLLLGPNEQRQIQRRQLLNLAETATIGMGASANLYSEQTPSRIANPSEFFSWLYFKAHGRGVSQQTLRTLAAQTRYWLEAFPSNHEEATDSMSVGRTRFAFDARRKAQPAGEYEFALQNRPERQITLSVTQWEQALRWPAIVWMKVFLGLEAADESGDAWPVATGQWIHRWLANSIRDGGQSKFVDISCADEIRARIFEQADQFRERIAALCATRGRSVPDWWGSGWSNALYVADCLAAKVSDLSDWSEMAVEWPLIEPTTIQLGENEILRVRGRIDLILARNEAAQSQLGHDDFWVVDYKTGRQRGFNLRELRRRDTPERKFRKQLVEGRGVQLALYALAVHALGGSDVQLTLLSPAEELEPQFRLRDVFAQKGFWSELHRMQTTGIFGMLGPVHADFGFARKYPLATLPIDSDLLEEKWGLTHPAFVIESPEETK